MGRPYTGVASQNPDRLFSGLYHWTMGRAPQI